MKKLLKILILSSTLYSLFSINTSPAFGQNKCGVNVGPKYDQIGKVSQLTGNGGWVVALGSPGDCSNFEGLFGKGLNVVIRAYNGGKRFTNEQALGWVATLGKMNTKGQMIYFMPWNEPNHTAEGGGPTAGDQVYQYSSFLKEKLDEAGLLGTKIILLSPMVDKLNPSFINGSFFTNQGGKSGFYNLFSNSSINEYDQFSPGPCSSSVPEQNNCLYDQISISPPYYSLETGVAGTCDPPCYRDSELRRMLDTSWNKWAGDGNFKMFAIFSYDPHREGDWDIFRASEVKNFYSSHCTPGGVTPNNFDPNLKFNQWFATNQNSFISCNGCGYATNERFCGSVGFSGKPEIIYPDNSLICTNFDVYYHFHEEQVQEIVLTPTPIPTSVLSTTTEKMEKELTGTFKLDNEEIPDFSQMEARLYFALGNLLPYDSVQQLSISREPLKTRLKHFVEKSETPETETTLSSWWTALLGETKILCALFNVCEPPKSVAIEVEQPKLEVLSNSLDPGSSCWQTEIVKSEPLEVKTIEDKFSITAMITKTVEVIEETIGNILRITTKTTEDATLKNKTRGWLVGGKTLEEQTDFDWSFIPLEMQVEGSPLATYAKYSVSPNFTLGSGSEKLNNQELNKVRTRYCLHLCTLFQAKYEIKEVDPICISCNPKDYEITFPAREFPGTCSAGGNVSGNCCDYGNATYHIPDRDPLCNRDNCHAEYFPEPSTPYSECYYCNPNVCVRNDRSDTSKVPPEYRCAATCNWNCCQ